MTLDVREVLDPSLKSSICRDIINALPEWFGIPQSTQKYIKGVAAKDCFAIFGENDVPAGLIAIKYHFGEIAEIWWMGVSPERHRQGIGQTLFEAARQRAVEKGCKHMVVLTLSELSADERYARTRQFYERMGFRTFLYDHEEDPVHPLVWMKTAL